MAYVTNPDGSMYYVADQWANLSAPAGSSVSATSLGAPTKYAAGTGGLARTDYDKNGQYQYGAGDTGLQNAWKNQQTINGIGTNVLDPTGQMTYGNTGYDQWLQGVRGGTDPLTKIDAAGNVIGTLHSTDEGGGWEDWGGDLVFAALMAGAGGAGLWAGAGAGLAGAEGALGAELGAGNLSSLGAEWGGGSALTGGAGAGGAGTGAIGGGMELSDLGGNWWDMGGSAGDLGGVGGSGLTEAEMNTLIQQAQQEIANGSVGSTGAAGMGQTSYLNQLQSLLNGGGTGSGSGLPPGTQSALQKILGGSGGASDWLSLAGKVAPGILAALGSKTQSSAYKDLADKYGQYGLPALGRLESSYAPGFDVASLPGLKGAMDTASGSLLAKLSATGGNPFGQPGGLIEANKQILNGVALPALNNYRAQNLQQAGLGIGPAYGADTAAAQNAGGLYTGLSSALGGALAPQNDLATLLRTLQGVGGLNLSQTLA